MSALLFAAALWAPLVQADQNRVSTMDTFAHSDGSIYFEFGIQAPEVDSEIAKEVVFLFDTSASQCGPVRREQFDLLRSTIEELPAGTQAQLIAIDVEPVAFTERFLDAQSEEFLAAVDHLQKSRVPLGSTNMEKGIRAVLAAFGQSQNPEAKRTVIYFGDGQSTARFINVQRMRDIVQSLVSQKISFSGASLGVNSNSALIGAFANHTGGVVVDSHVLSQKNSVETVGSSLARSLDANVYWVDQDSVKYPESWELHPTAVPPLRSDRETILIGKSSVNPSEAVFSLKGKTVDAIVKDMSWDLQSKTSKESRFLVGIYETAALDDGIFVPLAGREVLNRVKAARFEQMIQDHEILMGVAKNALLDGKHDIAARFAQKVLEESPDGNKAAKNLLERAAKTPSVFPTLQDNGNSGSGGPVDNYLKSNTVRTQSIDSAVNVAIGEAERLMQDRPDIALQHLKLMKSYIQNDEKIPPEARNRQVERLEAKMKSASQQQKIVERRQIEQDALLAEKKYREEIAYIGMRTEEKVRQILDRFAALVDAGFYHQAQVAADYASELVPGRSGPPTASLFAGTAGTISEIELLKIARQRGMVDALMSVERSFVPLSDEPPLLYPDPEVWRALSERRIAEYEEIDLSLASSSNVVRSIRNFLKDTAQIDSEEYSTLQDLTDELQEKYNIVIDYDRKAIEDSDAGNGPESAFVGTYAGITHQSALKRILGNLELTYTIRDECLLITTPEEVMKKMNVKVYPIGDLTDMPEPSRPSNNSGSGGGSSRNSNSGSNRSGGGSNSSSNWSVPSKWEKMMKASAIQNGLIPMNGNSFFAVNDPVVSKARKTEAASGEVKVAVKTTAAPASLVEKTQKIDHSTIGKKKIDLRKMNQKNPDAYWEEVFSVSLEQRPNEREVAITVFDLFRRARTNPASAKQIVSLIENSIKFGDVQPWMYESLAVALDMSGAPQSEIDRAVLSAQDFSTDPMELLFIAVYLRQLGSTEKALELYAEASDYFPMRPEPLAQAIELLLREDVEKNEEIVRSLALTAASHAWDGRWAKEIRENGLLLAEWLGEKMKAEGREEDCKAFREELDQALQRDCIVIVDFSGDAELDLYVKEPSETYCWFSNPRTTSGGILLQSPQRFKEIDSEGLNRVVYVCPKGFSGKYEVLVQRAWGKIANDKFRMRILKNTGTENETISEDWYQLGENGAIVKFELENARLDQSLLESEIDSAIVSEVSLRNRAEISRELSALTERDVLIDHNMSSATKDPRSRAKGSVQSQSSGSVASRSRSGQGQVNEAALLDWANRRITQSGDAPGYELEVEWFDFGPAVEDLVAVVSADRRYVRLNPGVSFNSLMGVFTYNSTTGDSGGGYGNSGSSNSNSGNSNNSNSNSSNRSGSSNSSSNY